MMVLFCAFLFLKHAERKARVILHHELYEPRLFFFQHDLLKSTHLFGSLPGLEKMHRKLTKDKRLHFKRRLVAWMPEVIEVI